MSKSHVITMRVSEEFKKKLDTKSGDLSNSKYIRQKLREIWVHEETMDQENELISILQRNRDNKEGKHNQILDPNLILGLGHILSADRGVPPMVFVANVRQRLKSFADIKSLTSKMGRYEEELFFMSLLQEWSDEFELSSLAEMVFTSMYLTWISKGNENPIFNAETLSMQFFDSYNEINLKLKENDII